VWFTLSSGLRALVRENERRGCHLEGIGRPLTPARPREGLTTMFKKHSPLHWLSFVIVLAIVVVLLWLAQYLERASF